MLASRRSLDDKYVLKAIGIQLTDLGSSYGTFVGSGQRLNANSPMTLHRGDTFWLGSKEQMFRITGKGGK